MCEQGRRVDRVTGVVATGAMNKGRHGLTKKYIIQLFRKRFFFKV